GCNRRKCDRNRRKWGVIGRSNAAIDCKLLRPIPTVRPQEGNGMRIVISGRAAVYPESDHLPSDPAAVPVTAPKVLRTLDGYDAEPEDELADDLDPSLRRAGVRGGTLRFAYDRKRKELRAVTEYRCRRRLT